jgi:uncharacterized protein
MADPVVYSVDIALRVEHLGALRLILRDMLEQAEAQIGFVQGAVAEPASPDHPIFSIVLDFKDEAALSAWLGSAAHRAFVERIRPFAIGSYSPVVRSALAGWVPSQKGRVPPKYKSAIATFSGLFPLLLTLRWILGWLGIDRLGPALGLGVTLAISCALMTWLVMPTVTRLLAPWLYAPTDSAAH